MINKDLLASSRNAARTAAEKYFVENLLWQDESFLDSSISIYPSSENEIRIKNYFNFLVEENSELLEEVNNEFNDFRKWYEIKLLELYRYYKLIKQKSGVFSFWNSKDYSDFRFDNFSNFDSIKDSTLNVDVNQNLCTLPVERKEVVDIKEIGIVSGNGRVGNSDFEVQDNQTLNSLIKEGFFEYERFLSGPVNLILQVKLRQPSILNKLELGVLELFPGYDLKINDVIFKYGSERKSIKQLVDVRFANLSFDTNTEEDNLILNFLPVMAAEIELDLQSNQKFNDRYAIGLKYIRFIKESYAASGILSSNDFNVNQSFVIGYLLNIFPFSSKNNFSITIGNNKNDNLPRFGTFLTDGKREKASYSLELFNNAVSEGVPEYSVFKYSLGKFNNTVIKPAAVKNTAFKEVFRRGKPLTIGKTTGGDQVFDLPLSLDVEDAEDLQVYVNGILLSKDVSISETTFDYEDWGRSIRVTNTENKIVQASLLPEKVFFEEKNDHFFFKPKFLFNPDKSTIVISRALNDANLKTVLIPTNKKSFYLGFQSIQEDSELLFSTENTAFNKVNSRQDLADYEDYFIDYEYGIIYFFEARGSDTVRISFKTNSIDVLKDDDYEIEFEDGVPSGVLIRKDSISFERYEEDFHALQNRFNIIQGAIELRVDTGITSPNKHQFSQDYIIPKSVLITDLFSDSQGEEIEFIDGITEFLGLVKVENEFTNAMTADNTGLISFYLSARSRFYDELGVSITYGYFTDRVTLPTVPSAPGEYSVSPDGEVLVYVGSEEVLPGGIQIVYYYKGDVPIVDSRYSIDYRYGILYANRDINPNSKFSYLAGNYKIEYNIVEALSFTEQNDNLVFNLNSNTEIICITQKESAVRSTSYFSPLVYSVGFGLQ